MRIGYDFDGVLTMNVGSIDIRGERHSTNTKTNTNVIIFELIRDKILSELLNRNDIYIISRNKSYNVVPLLERYFPEILKRIPKNNIITDLGDLSKSKSEIVLDLSLDEFYDDSPLNVHDINRLRKKNIIKTDLFIVNPDTNSYQKIKRNNLKILTYNVSWENMKGEKNKRGIIHNEECFQTDLCASNISSFIQNEFPLDFILIQEASRIEVIISNLPHSSHIILYKSGLETILTIVDSHYKIINSIGGEFEYGRPFLCTFLSNSICLINVHMGHKEDFYSDMHIIESVIRKHKYSNETFKSYRIIIGGDFNQKLNSTYTFMGKTIYKNVSTPSCGLKTKHNDKSFEDLNLFKMNYADHIFDSADNIVYSMNLTPLDSDNLIIPASDHLAIYAELLK
jgi:hypothetical protein